MDENRKRELLAESQAAQNQTDIDVDVWRQEYDEVSKTLPDTDDILRAKESGSKLTLNIDCQPGKPPFIFARAYVSMIVGEQPAWYIYNDTEGQVYHGLKVIMSLKSREAVIRKFGVVPKVVQVSAIKILRRGEGGNCLIGEVAEW